MGALPYQLVRQGPCPQPETQGILRVSLPRICYALKTVGARILLLTGISIMALDR
jgi:hypothetical protein